MQLITYNNKTPHHQHVTNASLIRTCENAHLCFTYQIHKLKKHPCVLSARVIHLLHKPKKENPFQQNGTEQNQNLGWLHTKTRTNKKTNLQKPTPVRRSYVWYIFIFQLKIRFNLLELAESAHVLLLSAIKFSQHSNRANFIKFNNIFERQND